MLLLKASACPTVVIYGSCKPEQPCIVSAQDACSIVLPPSDRRGRMAVEDDSMILPPVPSHDDYNNDQQVRDDHQ